MTLLFIDGFDHYSIGQMVDKWNHNASMNLGSAYGRFGSQGVRSYGGSYYFNQVLAANKTTVYVGFAFYRDSGGVLNEGNYGQLKFIDELSVAQIYIRVNTSLGFTVLLGNGSELGTSADAIFKNYKWCYIEAKVTISDTVGVVEVKLNGTQIINLTSQDTKNGSDYIQKIEFGGMSPNQYCWFDDIYIDDSQFHGDCRVKTFVPDSISPTNDSFTASAGNKDECVDEIPPNEDTDYIVSDTLNHKQGFGITTGVLGTVKAIQLNNHCRLDEAGTRKITSLIRSNSTDYLGTETAEISASYYFEHEIWELDPDDSGAWDQTKLEAAEFGLEITT